MNVPPWRANAPAGQTLAQAAAAQQPSGKDGQSGSDKVEYKTFIRPSARDRWMSQRAANYTPDRIEQVLRSAMTGNLVAQWELFDIMEDTWPRLAKNLNELKRAVKALQRNVEPWAEEEESAAPEAVKRARVVSRALWTMRPRADENQNGYDDTIYDILDAWGKGIAVLEVDWQVRESGKLGSIVGPLCTRWIHPRYYGYPTNADWLGLNVTEIANARSTSTDAISGKTVMDLKAVDGTYARFPEHKFLIAVCKSKSGHPSVGGLLRPLAFWWAASNFSQQWFLNFAQIFGLPIRWANYDPNTPGLLDQVADMLENMGTDAWGAFPAGTTLELKEPMKAGTDNPQVALLDRADKNCDLLILGQTLTTDVGDSGSRALGDVHKSVRDEIVVAAGEFVAMVLNQQLVPSIVALNFSDGELVPEICLEPDQISDTKDNAERDKVLLEQGIEMPKAWFYKRHNIPLPEDGEETIVGQAPADPNVPPGGDRFELSMAARGRRCVHQVNARGQDPTEKIVDHALEHLQPIEARWLGGLRPVFEDLIAKARDESLTDADFVEALAKAKDGFPDLFDKLKPEALEDALYNAMSAGAVNGVAKGFMKRRRAA